MTSNCFDSYQISLSYEASDEQIAEFDELGSSIYSLTICDSEDTPNICEPPFNPQMNSILSVTKNDSNLVFNMYVQLPYIFRYCTLTAVEYLEISNIINSLSYLAFVSPDVSETLDQLFDALDETANINDVCNDFNSSLLSIITKANELKDLLVPESEYEADIELINEMIDYVNDIISSIPTSPDLYESLEFCIVSNNDEIIHSFPISSIPPNIISYNNNGFTITRVPTRVIKVDQLNDEYIVNCINNSNEYPVTVDECSVFSQIFIPKLLLIEINIGDEKFHCLNEMYDIRLQIGSTSIPVNFVLIEANNSIAITLNEEIIINYIESNNIDNVITNEILNNGLFSTLELYPLSIVGTIKYKYKYSHYDDNKCRIGFGCNGCYINFNNNNCDRVYRKTVNLLEFRINSQEYSDFTVKLCDDCEVETMIAENYDPELLSKMYSLSYSNCYSVREYAFHGDSDVSSDILLEELSNIVIPNSKRNWFDGELDPVIIGPCEYRPLNWAHIPVTLDLNHSPLMIGVGPYKQSVNFAQVTIGGTTYSSQVHISNNYLNFPNLPNYTYIARIYIVVERIVSVSDIMTLLYGIVNPNPSSQEYIDVKTEMANLGVEFESNDTYKMIVMYRFVNGLLPDGYIQNINLPTPNIALTELGLPAEVLIYTKQNGVFSFHSAFDDEPGLSLFDNVYYMLTALNSNVRFNASRNFYITCEGDNVDFSINFSIKTLTVGFNN